MSEEEKITLQIKNVNAKDRYLLNDLSRHLCRDRGDLISEIIRDFAYKKFDSRFVEVADANFDYDQEEKRSFNKASADTSTNNVSSSPSSVEPGDPPQP